MAPWCPAFLLLVASSLVAFLQVRAQSSGFLVPKLPKNGERIVVQWGTTFRYPAVNGSIRLYCPSSSSAGSFIDELRLSAVNIQHRALLFRPVINMRDVECEFRYYSPINGFEPSVKGWKFQFVGGPNVPLQAHLSMTSKMSEMRLTWVSGTRTSPIVKFFPIGSDESMARNITATMTTYSNSDMCGQKANLVDPRWFRDPGYIHTAVLDGLQPNTLYSYMYGSEGGAMSELWNFTSRQPAESERATVVVFGDMGAWGSDENSGQDIQNPPPVKVISHVNKLIDNEPVDLVAHVGDLSYAQGHGYIWERFFYRIQPVASRVPYHITIGNHEYDHVKPSTNDPSNVTDGRSYNPPWGNYGDDSNGECAVPVFHRFKMPQSPGSNSVFWYSHNVVNVHMTYISTEHDLSPGSTQYKWLEADLAAVNETSQPWKVVLGHRPLYNSQTGWLSETRVGEELRKRVEPLFKKYGVNVYFAGHYHSYERTYPVYQDSRSGNLTNPTGTVHVTVGTAGAHSSTAPFNSSATWAAARYVGYGYSVFRTNSTHMHLSLIDVTTEQERDSAVIGRFVREPTQPLTVATTPMATTRSTGTTLPVSTRPRVSASPTIAKTTTSTPSSGGGGPSTGVIVAIVLPVLVAVIGVIVGGVAYKKYKDRPVIHDGKPLVMNEGGEEPL